MDPSEPVIRVVALSRKSKSSSVWTWSLRVGNLIPHLRKHRVLVETCPVPTDARSKAALFRRLGGFDIAWLHRHIMWPIDLVRTKRFARRLVFDYDDPVCYSPTNPGHFSLTRWLKFRATVRRSVAVLAATDRLVELARRYNRRVVFAPLSLDLSGYRMTPTHRSLAEPFRLLWLGSRSTFRYLRDVRPHLEAIGEACPGTELVVVGHSELQLRNLPVRNLPWSPATEAEQLARCHLGLVPVPEDRWAEGKAAMKPLQYMASGMPILGTPRGGNVRLVDGGRNGWLGQTPQDWARGVRWLSRDEGLRTTLAGNAVDYIRRNHAPEVLAVVVAKLFRSIADQRLSRRFFNRFEAERPTPSSRAG